MSQRSPGQPALKVLILLCMGILTLLISKLRVSNPQKRPSATIPQRDPEQPRLPIVEDPAVHKITIFDPLDQGELRLRTQQSFGSVYLNCISIIQGGALALVITKFCEITIKSPALLGSWVFVLRNILIFAGIVCITYEYNWFVSVHRWNLTFFDTIIPFVLGGLEIASIMLVQHDIAWWIIITTISAGGMMAFCNTLYHCKDHYFKNNDLYKFIHDSVNESVFAGLIMTLTAISPVIIYLIGFTYSEVDVFFSAMYIGIVITLIIKDQLFVNELFKRLQLR